MPTRILHQKVRLLPQHPSSAACLEIWTMKSARTTTLLAGRNRSLQRQSRHAKSSTTKAVLQWGWARLFWNIASGCPSRELFVSVFLVSTSCRLGGEVSHPKQLRVGIAFWIHRGAVRKKNRASVHAHLFLSILLGAKVARGTCPRTSQASILIVQRNVERPHEITRNETMISWSFCLHLPKALDCFS